MGTPSFSDWLDFMPETVTVNSYVSQSVSGAKTYNPTAVSYPARIELKNHRIVDMNGREILAKGRVFLGTTTIIDTRDKLTLPAGYVPQTPPILAVNPVADESGTHHVTLEIG